MTKSCKNQIFSYNAMFSFLKLAKLCIFKDKKRIMPKDFGLCCDILYFPFLLPFIWSKLGKHTVLLLIKSMVWNCTSQLKTRNSMFLDCCFLIWSQHCSLQVKAGQWKTKDNESIDQLTLSRGIPYVCKIQLYIMPWNL